METRKNYSHVSVSYPPSPFIGGTPQRNRNWTVYQHQFSTKEIIETWPRGIESRGFMTEDDRMRGKPVPIPSAVNLAEDSQGTASPTRVNNSGMGTLMHPMSILGSTRVRLRKFSHSSRGTLNTRLYRQPLLGLTSGSRIRLWGNEYPEETAYGD